MNEKCASNKHSRIDRWSFGTMQPNVIVKLIKVPMLIFPKSSQKFFVENDCHKIDLCIYSIFFFLFWFSIYFLKFMICGKIWQLSRMRSQNNGHCHDHIGGGGWGRVGVWGVGGGVSQYACNAIARVVSNAI